MDKTTPRSFWITILAFTFIVNLIMARATYLRLVELEANLMRSTWSGMIVLCIIISVWCVWLALRLTGKNLPAFFNRIDQIHLDTWIWRILGVIIFLAILYSIPHIKFAYRIGQDIKKPAYDPSLILFIYYWMCWWAILLAASASKAALNTSWAGGFATALVMIGIAFEVHYRYSFVNDYPFSLGWSEGSRYYYASLFFSRQIYGQQYPLSTLHPSRYLLQSFPFLFPGLRLFVHRFWQFLLWIGLTTGSALALTKRVFADREKTIRWLTAGWVFLFLLRVGVYYHLEVMVILPLLFISMKKDWQSLLVVILSSLWAGISRVNWFPLPAMIAISIYLLEIPLSSPADEKASIKKIANYIGKPALWAVAGLGSALLAQWAYVYISGNAQNSKAFTSSFTSDLLWYRLWPNDNYPLGIIPAILIVSGPLLITLILSMRRWRSLHTIRWLGLTVMILALFLGSAVVSTKIGGGGDLHNMDAYAVLTVVVALYFFGGTVQVEPGEADLQIRSSPLYAIALVTPLLFLIPMLSPYPKYNENRNQQAYRQLIDVVNKAGRNGPVLFISERQAIAIGDVNVPLVYDYEVVTLMEMVMSGNQQYLENFYNDLSSRRFAAIISGRQNLAIKQDGIFAEENNAWNTSVSPYVLCYYESSTTIEADQTRLEIYVPRTELVDCPVVHPAQ